jgi:hypothetical protein
MNPKSSVIVRFDCGRGQPHHPLCVDAGRGVPPCSDARRVSLTASFEKEVAVPFPWICASEWFENYVTTCKSQSVADTY